jgi:hypothetical protein
LSGLKSLRLNKMVNAWMTHMKPYIAEEKKESKKSGRKFNLGKAIKAARKTYKKKSHKSGGGLYGGESDSDSDEEDKAEMGGRRRRKSRGGKTRRHRK